MSSRSILSFIISTVHQPNFEFLEESAENGKAITINWRYRPEDDTMQEAGEDFEEDVSACSYNMVQVESLAD